MHITIFKNSTLVKNSTLKSSKINTKSYIYLFVCFTKVIHIKLVIDLSINSFLNYLKRFIARQGLCHNIYSNNETNFVGARNELLEFEELISNKKRNSEIILYYNFF